MIESAFDNKDELDKVINILLDKKLVASCHVIESESLWNWNNERENSKEYLLQMKTKKSKVESIFEIIKSIHSYECFEFAIYEISSINKDYLKWIDDEVI
jgi:periplasmic divalent cation tolerance protein